jgi:hypothetical protein
MSSPIVVTLRNNSLVPPLADRISVKELAAANGMTSPYSLRQLLDRRDKTRVRRYAVWIWTPTDGTRKFPWPAYWYDRAFGNRWGVATFFREMSGGRQYVEWQVIDKPLLSSAQKAAADNTPGQPGAGTVAAFRQAAQNQGQNISDYDLYVWVIDDGTANRGQTPSDSLITARDGDVQLFCHEMTHGFRLCPHADRTTYDDYSDPFCIMGKGPIARSFENEQVEYQGWPYDTLGTTGPGLCAPYLAELGWLDYAQQVVSFPASALPPETLVTIFANHGAPPEPTVQIALVLGDRPTKTTDPPQYWIEYRQPSRLDRDIISPVTTKTPDLPRAGVVILHEVSYLQARCIGRHSYVRDWKPARVDQAMRIPAIRTVVKVLDVHANGSWIALAIFAT